MYTPTDDNLGCYALNNLFLVNNPFCPYLSLLHGTQIINREEADQHYELGLVKTDFVKFLVGLTLIPVPLSCI